MLKKTVVATSIVAGVFFAPGVFAKVLDVTSEIGDNGYHQIKIHTDQEERFVTDTEYSNTNPVTDGQFITWLAQSDKNSVQLGHFASDYHITLSGRLNSANPQISRGNVVWEEYVAGESPGWQVFLFDGIRKLQLTSGDESRNPYVEEDYTIFGRKAPESDWYAELYNLATKESVRVAEGIAAKVPIIVEGQVVLRGRGYSEPIGKYVQDVLPAEDRDTNKQVTSDDIRQELGIIPQ